MPLIHSTEAPSIRGHIPALDGLRGIAILLVMMYHYFAQLGFTTPGLRECMGIIHSGWVGVDLFFVLSGFLITGILCDSKTSPHYFRNFYARRTLRIFPLYYAVLLVVFVILPLFHPPISPAIDRIYSNQAWLWLYGANIPMGTTGEFFFNADWLLMGHFWSLAMEEQFYLLWPAFIWLLSRRGAIGLCITLIAAALITRIALTLNGHHPVGLYILPWCRMDSLAVGSLTALLLRSPALAPITHKAARLLLPITFLALAILFARTGELSNIDPLVQTAGYSLLAFFFASLLVLVVLQPPNTRIERIFSFAPLRTLGKYSYAMYIFHALLAPAFESFFGPEALKTHLHSFRLAILAHALLATLATFAIAFLSWHLFESHFLKLKRFFEYTPPATRAPVAPEIPPISAHTTEMGPAGLEPATFSLKGSSSTH